MVIRSRKIVRCSLGQNLSFSVRVPQQHLPRSESSTRFHTLINIHQNIKPDALSLDLHLLPGLFLWIAQMRLSHAPNRPVLSDARPPPDRPTARQSLPRPASGAAFALDFASEIRGESERSPGRRAEPGSIRSESRCFPPEATSS